LKLKRNYYFLGLFALFVIIQLIPVDRENPTSNPELDLTASLEVTEILKNSCYDCHSNQTNWPYYSYVAPISWLVSRDVKNGRKNLNFSEWNKLSTERKNKVKEEMMEEISEDEMPLPIYLFMHPAAKLSDEEKTILKEWFGRTGD